jgi:hypothetical protein
VLKENGFAKDSDPSGYDKAYKYLHNVCWVLLRPVRVPFRCRAGAG